MASAQPQQHELEAAVRVLLQGLGEDPQREGLLDTPKRVAKALMDASSGYLQEPQKLLSSAQFNEPIVHQGGQTIVLVREIDFASTSLTSLLPFHGRVHVAYVPSNGVVLGLSKLARLTKVFSKRLQTQERLGRDIASALSRYLACQGVAVLISAKQLLLSGAQQPQAVLTACTGGSFTSDPSQLEEVLCMLGLSSDDLQLSRISSLEGSVKDTATGTQTSQQTAAAAVHHGRSSSVCSRAGATTSRLASIDTLPTAPATPDPSEGDSDLMSEKGSESESDAGLLCLCMDEPAGAADCGAMRGRSTGLLACHSCTAGDSSSSSSSSTGGASDPGRSRIMQHLLYDSSSFCTKAISLPDMSALQCSSPSSSGASKTHGSLIPTSLPVVSTSTCSCLGAHTCGAAFPVSPLDQRVRSMEQAALTLATAMLRGPAGAALFHSAPQALEAAAQNYVSSLLAATSGYVAKLPTAVKSASGSSSTSTSAPGGCPWCSKGAVSSEPQTSMVASAATAPAGASSSGVVYAATLPFNSQCEHHMLPFYGSLTVVYYTDSLSGSCTSTSGACASPQQCGSEEAGQGTAQSRSAPLPPPAAVQEALQQIAHAFTQRLQVQERITHQVADAAAQLLMGSTPASGLHRHHQQHHEGQEQGREGSGISSVVVAVDAAHMCMVARGVENHAGRTTTVAARGRAEQDAQLRSQALRIARAAAGSPAGH